MFLNIYTISVCYGNFKFLGSFRGVKSRSDKFLDVFQYSGGQNASYIKIFMRYQGPFKNNGVKQALIVFNKNISQI